MWAAAVLQPGGLKTAQLNLERQSFESYSPRLYCPVERQEVPLLAGYLLVKLTEAWGSIKSTRGIASLVMVGSQLGLINDDEVALIKSKEGPDGLIRPHRIDAGPRFPAGRRVRLLPRSRMAGNKGSIVTYQAAKPDEHASVLMRLLGRNISLVVREEDLVAL